MQSFEDKHLYKKLEEVNIFIREFIFLFLYEKWSAGILREHERILDIIRDAWKGRIFLCDWVLQRGIGDPLYMWVQTCFPFLENVKWRVNQWPSIFDFLRLNWFGVRKT